MNEQERIKNYLKDLGAVPAFESDLDYGKWVSKFSEDLTPIITQNRIQRAMDEQRARGIFVSE